MKSVETKFLEAGIPYSELDRQIIPLVDVLTFDIGLTTEFSCYGHGDDRGDKISIVFADGVRDEDVLRFAEFLGSEKGYFVSFDKWHRAFDKDSGLRANWIMKSTGGWGSEDCPSKTHYFNELISVCKKYAELTECPTKKGAEIDGH
ncbi:hypothetical protein NGI46_08135 [Peribacillus butanolivorans]|uniref:hypothetical protein n=1 Tax=Peribacillus butanolivorans TaxID=421767 RepID=UPI00207C9BC8|nr:hypothetical protein [Peribacillus butanolivorans]MCO0597436.1 hypothetical protein [Peribacillus butanolivorans]